MVEMIDGGSFAGDCLVMVADEVGNVSEDSPLLVTDCSVVVVEESGVGSGARRLSAVVWSVVTAVEIGDRSKSTRLLVDGCSTIVVGLF